MDALFGILLWILLWSPTLWVAIDASRFPVEAWEAIPGSDPKGARTLRRIFLLTPMFFFCCFFGLALVIAWVIRFRRLVAAGAALDSGA